MSGFLNNLNERRERLEERLGGRRERHDRGGGYDDHDDHHQRYRHEDGDEERRRPQAHESQFQSQGRGYGAPPGPPSHESQFQSQGRGYGAPPGPPPSARGPSGLGSLGGLDRGDFASDADIDRMISSGEFNQRQGREGRGYGEVGGERGNTHGRYDAPSAYGERANEYGRYDAPSGPPTGRGGYQSQQPHQQGYGSGGAYGSSYSGEPDHHDQYGPQQTHGRSQYEAPQSPPPGRGRGQGNTPSGGFADSRVGEERYGSGYGGPPSDRSEPPRRGEAASYYNSQGASGQADRYARLSGLAREHGDDDPELYRRATQGLDEKIQAQSQSRRSKRDDDDSDDDDYKAHVNAHRKAYEGDDHGPMDADTIGAAAAMEAFKQTTAASSNTPAGGFQTSKASRGSSPQPGRATREEEEGATASRGGSSGMQDKMMALAMSQAGKLFDKKNAGSSASGGDPSKAKAQAMQSAAATAMQLFAKYQSKGKLESGDMSQVMSLAKNLF